MEVKLLTREVRLAFGHRREIKEHGVELTPKVKIPNMVRVPSCAAESHCAIANDEGLDMLPEMSGCVQLLRLKASGSCVQFRRRNGGG